VKGVVLLEVCLVSTRCLWVQECTVFHIEWVDSLLKFRFTFSFSLISFIKMLQLFFFSLSLLVLAFRSVRRLILVRHWFFVHLASPKGRSYVFGGGVCTMTTIGETHRLTVEWMFELNKKFWQNKYHRDNLYLRLRGEARTSYHVLIQKNTHKSWLSRWPEMNKVHNNVHF
jgi:hypothetical protein